LTYLRDLFGLSGSEYVRVFIVPLAEVNVTNEGRAR